MSPGVAFGIDEILSWTSGRIANPEAGGKSAASVRVSRPGPLTGSTPSEISFFFSRDYESELPGARPGILITAAPFCKLLEAAGLPLWQSSVVVACDDPYLAMAILSEKFASALSTVAHLERPEAFVHPTAWVHPSARIGRDVRIGAHCAIEAGVEIGDGTVLYPSVTIGPGARVGSRSVIFASVVLYEHVRIGDRVRIHAGTVIGADGFGYAPERQGKAVVNHRKIFHFGSVVIGDDVEIGAGVTIDRGTVADTVVGPKAKIDNQVHLGHNAQVGEGAVLCGGICFAGSSSIGRFAYMGGMSGVNNRVHIGDGAMIGGMTMVTKDVPAGGTALGAPQREFREHLQVHAFLNRLYARKGADKDKKG